MSSLDEHHLTDPLFQNVQELIRINLEGAQTLRAAAKQVTDPSLRTIFERIARDRDAQALELQPHARSDSEAPEHNGDSPSVCRRGWRQLRSTLRAGDPAAALHAAERSEDRIKACYQQVIQEITGRALQTILLKQYRRIVDQHEHIRALRDTARTELSP